MKETGIVRKADELGRIVIPKELRLELGMFEGDRLEVFATRSGQIILQKYAPVMRKEG
jgi:AbrB family transcriptional regulator (stage V sporulation protein T)